MQSSTHLGEALSFVSAHRFGASLEVPDTLGFGSSLSLRSSSRVGSSVSVLGVVFLAFSLSVLDCCTAGIVSLFSQFRSTRCVFTCTGGTVLRELGRWFGNVVSKKILLGIVAVASGLVAVRCFSSVAHFLQARPWVLFIIEGSFSSR